MAADRAILVSDTPEIAPADALRALRERIARWCGADGARITAMSDLFECAGIALARPDLVQQAGAAAFLTAAFERAAGQ